MFAKTLETLREREKLPEKKSSLKLKVLKVKRGKAISDLLDCCGIFSSRLEHVENCSDNKKRQQKT
jgi:hypothetical protein